MAQPAVKQGDQIVATDVHIVLVPTPPAGTVPTPLPHPFFGAIQGNLSTSVRINNVPAATVGSTANNTPPHIPTPPGVSFQVPPTNQGVIMKGSASVFINGKPAARVGDTVQTCGDPPNTTGQIISTNTTVLIGG
ncbi:MAG: PAAR domain-containing protein [Chloroflexota bacterium]